MSKASKNILQYIANLISTKKLNSVDLNKLTTLKEDSSFNSPGGTGVWYVTGVTNGSPTGGAAYGMLFQMRSPLSMHPTAATAVYAQLFIAHNGKVYSRAFNNGSWTTWATIK